MSDVWGHLYGKETTRALIPSHILPVTVSDTQCWCFRPDVASLQQLERLERVPFIAATSLPDLASFAIEVRVLASVSIATRKRVKRDNLVVLIVRYSTKRRFIRVQGSWTLRRTLCNLSDSVLLHIIHRRWIIHTRHSLREITNPNPHRTYRKFSRPDPAYGTYQYH